MESTYGILCHPDRQKTNKETMCKLKRDSDRVIDGRKQIRKRVSGFNVSRQVRSRSTGRSISLVSLARQL
jgi:hypothetical protein